MQPKIDLERVARAARIRLTEAEARKFSLEIEGILENFRMIEEVDVEGVEPSFNPLRAKAAMREDVHAKWDFDPLANVKPNLRVRGKVAGPKVLGK